MKEKELKRLEALERKMDNVFKWVESHQTEGKRIGEYARGGVRMRPGVPNEELKLILKEQGIHIHKTDEPLDLTKILEVGDEVCSDVYGRLIVTTVEPTMIHAKESTTKRNPTFYGYLPDGTWPDRDAEDILKPRNGKTWAQFIAEKEEKKQQIPTLEKAIEDIKKGLEKFDAPEVEVHMTLKKLKSGGYAPSKIHVTDH